jgi:glycerol-3-phosphate dehydrogenase subunit C
MIDTHVPEHLPVEATLDRCIKCNICVSFCPPGNVTDLFPGPKYVGPQAARFRQFDQVSPDESVDYCSGCRVCNLVCPTGVKIAEINARARAKMYADRGGIPLRNRLLGRSELLGKLGSPVAPLANLTLSNPAVRWAVERVLGVDRRAPLPLFSFSTFRGWFDGVHRPRRSERKVVFFHGCSTNYYEPRVGKAAVAVLEHNDIEVLVPPQNCCGLPMLSNGEFDAARRYHTSNVRKLLPYVQAGYDIVGTSTSCTLTLKEEAPELLDMYDADTRLVAAHTYDLFEYLLLLADDGQLKTDFRPLDRAVPYHPPCQLRAHRVGRPAYEVLAMIPGLRVNESEALCCGIAGTYGLKSEKYQIGMEVGRPLFEWLNAQQPDQTLCDSETCRWQITSATGIPTFHPVEILREAYGV